MGFSCGIVGLPNVGKSTLFNVLTKAGAASSNYPFCTIEPNIGVVPVFDERLDKIAQYLKPKNVIPAYMNFTDIAGLVKGASDGQGLGNQFLGHIKEVQAIVQVVRLFDEEDIIHIGKIDPVRDIEIILTELCLKDIEILEKRKKRVQKEARSKKSDAEEELNLINDLLTMISNEKRSLNRELNNKEKFFFKEYHLLSTKPMIIIANMGESQIANYENNIYYSKLKNYIILKGFDLIVLSAKLEEEIIALNEEASSYLSEMGIKKSGLNQLIQKGYELLNLQTFFTAGEKECRAWSISKGITASKAAAKIHTDFEKGFIRAEVISYKDFISVKGDYNKVREIGKLRIEGKNYLVLDGDIIHFRFNI